MKKIGEKIVKIITNIMMIIVVFAIFFASYNFISLNILKNDYVNMFGYTIFDVATGSMSGTIEINDVIIVKLYEEYKVGDIVTYKNGSDLITHRIIQKDDKVCITKGDANNTADNPIDESLIIGKVIKILPEAGLWKKVVMTPKVIISLLATLLLFSFAFSYTAKNNNKNKVTENNNNTDNKEKTNEIIEKEKISFENENVIEEKIVLNQDNTQLIKHEEVIEENIILDEEIDSLIKKACVEERDIFISKKSNNNDVESLLEKACIINDDIFNQIGEDGISFTPKKKAKKKKKKDIINGDAI